MKIAIVSPVMNTVPPEKYGGIELIVAELAAGLAKRKHRVTVFCSGGSKIEGDGISRVETSPYPTRDRLEENRRWEIDQLLTVLSRQHEFDVIHFNYEPLALRFTFDGTELNLLDFFTTPVVLTFHNITNIPENEAYYRRTHSLYRHTLIFVSENHRRPVSFFPKTKVIYNALRIDDFPVCEDKENYLFFLGRITPVKGILEAIAVAKKTGIPLVIAAKVDSVDRDFYEKTVKPKIDGKLIKYVGEVDFAQKVDYLKKTRCLLFPILWEEPFGLVMAEALACGTPVVAFRRGSVPEIVKDGVNGYVVDTVDEMTEAVKKLDVISSSECRKSVEKRFYLDRMVNEYEELFRKVYKKAESKKF